MGILEAYNKLHPFDEHQDWIYSSEYTEEEYNEWINSNLEQYYKENTDGTLEKTGE